MKIRDVLIIVLNCLVVFINAQQVRRLNDPAIVAQHRRMVFQSWGDWRPYPKYTFFGIQTNFAYATVWGRWAPSRNRRYKNGPDIRPLSPVGKETQRLLTLEQQLKEAEKIKVSVDTIYTRNLHDYAHYQPLTVDADPLWLLYYKRMLSELNNFPEQPKTYIEWKLPNQEVYNILIQTGGINNLQERLDGLKEKYKLSRTAGMPRGKRFLMYHETLIGWRQFKQALAFYEKRTGTLMNYKKILDKYKNENRKTPKRTDMEIVTEVMNQYKNQF